MRCTACGGENPDGKRFCKHCGGILAALCASCGAPLEPDNQFCGDCGTPISAPAAPSSSRTVPSKSSQPGPGSGPVSERRLCSVLFVDLVGFTPLAEKRDPEEIRELLSIYFDRAQAIVGHYGGTVEKFIGDAVMAVWGAPVANEDDAERAVRAALEVVAAVTELGNESGVDLAARAGVVTGEVAITIDDGPDSEVTPAVLAILAAHRARATFFCIAARAEHDPQLVRACVAQGHAIENHSYYG